MPIILQVVKINRHMTTRFHHVHQAEVVESCSLSPIPVRKIDAELGRTWKTVAGLLPKLFWHVVSSFQLSRMMTVTSKREADATASAGTLWIIIERPVIPCSVVTNWSRAEFARDKWRDERAARLVL